jgi:hypothetical protein
MCISDEYKATIAPELLKDAYVAGQGTFTVRVLVPPPFKAKLDPWTNMHPFDLQFEYEDIQIGILDIDGFGLPCGFGKRSGVWVVGGKLERWELTQMLNDQNYTVHCSIDGVTDDEVTYLESQQERLGQEVAEAFNAAFDAWLQKQIDGSGIKNPKGLLSS